MKESRDFARAYAAAVERAPKVKKFAPPAEERKAVVYQSNTAEFEAALGKISKGLLAVLDSQFGSKPQSLVVGGIKEERSAEKSDAAAIEDESVLRIFEEEDSE